MAAAKPRRKRLTPEERKALRERKRAIIMAAAAAACDVPPGFQRWGVMRGREWGRMVGQLSRAMDWARPSLVRIERLTGEVLTFVALTDEQYLAILNARAAFDTPKETKA